MDKSTKTTLIVAGILIFLYLLGSYNPVSKTTDEEWLVAKQLFMYNCNTDRESDEYCNCVFNELERDLGRGGFQAVAEDYMNNNKIAGEVLEAAEVCGRE